MKRIICLVLSLVFLISLTSCSLVDRFKGDMSLLDYDEKGDLLYGNNSYYRADGRFEVRTYDEVVELGWSSQFPFFPDLHYYAFDEDNPLFIFCENRESTLYTKGLYVRSDFNLYTALYHVENTDIEISLADAMIKKEVDDSESGSQSYQNFRMFLKDDSGIQVFMWGPYKCTDGWYFMCSGESWILSDEFVAMLKENDIITE